MSEEHGGGRLLLALKNLAFTVLVPGTVGGLAPWWLGMRGDRVETPAWMSAPFFVVGIGVYSWCLWDFATFGRGTPAPIDAPKRLVVRGLYRVSRNPMYVGVLTTIVGWLVFSPNAYLAVYLVCVAAGFRAFVVGYEEPHLARVFGAEYEAYRERVGRWLVPPRRTGL